jgi:deoxyribose-phosphate aldolase
VVTERAITDGADEIDVVLPYRAWLAGDTDWAGEVLDGVRDAAGEHTMKVILETGELPDTTAVENASRFAIEHGADFIKTSTGKSPVSATLEAARAMLGVIKETDRQVGLKPSGGIRTFDDAAAYLALAAEVMGPDWPQVATFRFGASGLLEALTAVAGGEDMPGIPTTDY